MTFNKDYSYNYTLTDEIKSILQNKLSKKLSEIIGIEIDNVMVEYVIVMIGNRKTMGQIANDLIDFVGEESSEKFVCWLYNVLNENTSLPVSSSLPSSTVSSNSSDTIISKIRSTTSNEEKDIHKDITPICSLKSTIATPKKTEKEMKQPTIKKKILSKSTKLKMVSSKITNDRKSKELKDNKDVKKVKSRVISLKHVTGSDTVLKVAPDSTKKVQLQNIKATQAKNNDKTDLRIFLEEKKQAKKMIDLRSIINQNRDLRSKSKQNIEEMDITRVNKINGVKDLKCPIKTSSRLNNTQNTDKIDIPRVNKTNSIREIKRLAKRDFRSCNTQNTEEIDVSKVIKMNDNKETKRPAKKDLRLNNTQDTETLDTSRVNKSNSIKETKQAVKGINHQGMPDMPQYPGFRPPYGIPFYPPFAPMMPYPGFYPGMNFANPNQFKDKSINPPLPPEENTAENNKLSSNGLADTKIMPTVQNIPHVIHPSKSYRYPHTSYQASYMTRGLPPRPIFKNRTWVRKQPDVNSTEVSANKSEQGVDSISSPSEELKITTDKDNILSASLPPTP